MHGDSAISEILRKRVMPDTTLSGEANLIVFPTLDAANITLGIVKTMTTASMSARSCWEPPCRPIS